jgi:hypothetical protein
MCYNISPEYIVEDIKYAKTLNKLTNEDGTKKYNFHKIKFEFSGRTIRAWSVRHDNKLDPNDPDFRFGLFPFILKRLFDDRSKLKKSEKGLLYWEHIVEKMKLLPSDELSKPDVAERFEDAKFNFNAIDSKQKALKVFMNTFYGVSGQQMSPLFMLPVAGGITSAGRENIKKAYNFVKEHGCKVHYGDSVTPDTPILIRYTKGPLAGNIDIRTIDDIPGYNQDLNVNEVSDDRWVEYPQFKPAETEPIRINKEQHLVYDGLETWTSSGWAAIKRIIKHKTIKQIYRINTHTGCVDVTEDHSLLTATKESLSPKDAKIGDELFHSFPDEFPSEPKFIDNNIKLFDRISFDILNSSLEIRKKYFNDVYSDKGYHNKYGRVDFWIDSKIHAQCFYYLLRSIGYDYVGVQVLESQPSSYRVSILTTPANKKIRKIFTTSMKLNSDDTSKDYIEVYDIETETGDFQAGVGSIVIFNTDSIYLSIPPDSFKSSDVLFYTHQISRREYWEQMVNTSFKEIKPLNADVNTMFKTDTGNEFLKMSYEEFLYPCAFLAKKKYYGIPHISEPNFNTDKDGNYNLFIRGLDLKKRGVSDLLISVCSNILQISVDYNNFKSIMEIVLETIDDFYTKDWSDPEKLSAFVMTGVYKPDKQNVKMHVFRDRMLEERGLTLIPGDRVKYIIAKKYLYKYDLRGRKTALSVGDRLELFDIVVEENIPVDIDYYMENTIAGQLARLITYHEDFDVPISDIHDLDEIKKAEDGNLKLARKFIDNYCKKYFVTYNDRGKVYKSIFKKSSKLVSSSLSNMYGNDTSIKHIVKLLGFSVDVEGPIDEWLIAKAVSTVEQKKANKIFGKNYVENLLKKDNLKLMGKTRSEYARDLRSSYYTNKESSILKTSEDIYNERQQVLELRLRKSLNTVRAVYQANNSIIESVANRIKNKYSLQEIDSLSTQDIDEVDDEALEDIAEDSLYEKYETLTKDIAELKFLYFNLVGNYDFIYKIRSIVEYLKTLRDSSIGNVKPLDKEKKKILIENMIAESLKETMDSYISML